MSVKNESLESLFVRSCSVILRQCRKLLYYCGMSFKTHEPGVELDAMPVTAPEAPDCQSHSFSTSSYYQREAPVEK